MRNWLLLSALCLPFFGAMCATPAGSAIPLTCDNPLNGADFGFAIDLPATFDCTSTFPFPGDLIQGLVTYEDTSSGAQILVLVGSTAQVANQPGGDDSGVDCTDIGPFTNDAGIQFDRCRFDETEEDGTPRINFSGSAPLEMEGQIILISVVSDTADGLEAILDDVLNGVTF